MLQAGKFQWSAKLWIQDQLLGKSNLPFVFLVGVGDTLLTVGHEEYAQNI